MSADLLVLGCGFTGSAVARRALTSGQRVVGTVRSEPRAEALRADPALAGLDLRVLPALDPSIAREVDARTHVVVAFPPDGETDARLAPALAGAASVTYVSSTGVYGERTGHLDDRTPVADPPGPRARRILEAEQAWRAIGATVLRCPGIYGPERGLHRRILRGEHKIPGDGSRTLSRIHVEDLASLLLAAAEKRGETYVVGDLSPVPHIDVVRFVCEQRGLPLPPAVPWESVHETLRADRAVDASRALAELGVTLRYPSYREGMSV